MSIESPQTYADFHWKPSVEAQSLAEQETEKEISPLVKNLVSDILAFEDLPEGIRSILQTLAEPTGAKLGGFGAQMLGEIIGNALGAILDQPMKKAGFAMGRLFKGERIDAQTSAILNQRQWIDEAMYEERIAGAGYTEAEWKHFYRAQEPYPTVPDLITYARYQGGYDNVWGALTEFYNMDSETYKLWEWLGRQRLSTVQVQSLIKRGDIADTDFDYEIERIGWCPEDRENIKNLAYVLPNSMLLVQGGLIQELDDKIILENISKGDIHSDWAETYLDAVLTKPASQDIVAYELRQENKLANLSKELKKIGIHSKYTDIYETLAYQIPPVADIITMAVREAFTPEIAERFGQYEDFPADLEKYAGQKGLSADWAKRYWASHWALPSPQQGFEMLHRGVIDRPELEMLLRAQDVMPFWRDKLIQIAYRRLTRVDIRRMYREGVLSESDVLESYIEHGYNPENAARMAEFTVKQALTTLSKFTSGDIIKAFTNRMIDRGTAHSLLLDVGVRPEDVNYIISTAEYKRVWAFTDDQIAGIRNLYKKRIYNEDNARDRLAKLNLPAEQIEVLMQQWHYDKVEELDTNWTKAETLRYLKRKLITRERAKHELYLHGYTEERIGVILRDTEWKPPEI